MNKTQVKNHIYKNGEYNPNHSEQMVKDKAKSIIPNLSQVQYRDALYNFCIEKGLVRESFRLGRTRQTISANINAFITILRKSGYIDEFFGKESKSKGEKI